MRDVFSMWKETKMVVLVALCAGLYAALLIPFKALVLIPGITEIRPASVLPVVFGLLFGPAGAWGVAIGNLIGDFFGSFGIGSLFGFFGNFAFAYVPYKIWRNLGITPKRDPEPDLKSFQKIISFIVAASLGAFACALIIGWGLDLLNMVPFIALAGIIALNNVIPSVIIGIPLTILLYPRVKKWDLLWSDILAKEDLPPMGARQKLGAIVMTISILFGWFGGFMAATGVGQAFLNSAMAVEGAGAISIALIGGAGCCGLLVSSVMQ